MLYQRELELNRKLIKHYVAILNLDIARSTLSPDKISPEQVQHNSQLALLRTDGINLLTRIDEEIRVLKRERANALDLPVRGDMTKINYRTM